MTEQKKFKTVLCSTVNQMQSVVDFVRTPETRWKVSKNCGPYIELDTPGYQGCHSSKPNSTGHDNQVITFSEFERDYLKKTVNKDLTGRYMRALCDGAQGIGRLTKGTVVRIKSWGTPTGDLYPIGDLGGGWLYEQNSIGDQWELLPEDFNPDTPTSFKFEIGQKVKSTGKGRQWCELPKDGAYSQGVPNNNLSTADWMQIVGRDVSPNGHGNWYQISYKEGGYISERYSNWISEDGLEAVAVPLTGQTSEPADPCKNLLEEAKRRYPVGTVIRGGLAGSGDKDETYTITDKLYVQSSGITHYGLPWVYFDGKWAEIISKPEEKPTESVPEYVECINEGVWYGKLGQIYKVKNWNHSNGDCLLEGTTSGSTSKKRFKPSTREAYEAQKQKKYMEAYGGSKSTSQDFKVGDWVFVISGGSGAYGADGKVGQICTITNVSSGVSDPRRGITVAIDHEHWGLRKDQFKLRHATTQEIVLAQAQQTCQVTKIPEGRYQVGIDIETAGIKPQIRRIDPMPNPATIMMTPDEAWKQYGVVFNGDPWGEWADAHIRLDGRRVGKPTADLATAFGYSLLAGEKTSNKLKPSQSISVKVHEEFKINVKKQKSIKI